MSVHIYNNYYDGVSKYGVGVTYGACAFVENNYFRNCKYPMLISMQGSDSGTFSGENGGIIKSYNNYISGEKSYITYQQNSSDFDAYEVTNRTDLVPSDIKCKQGATGYNNFDTNTSVMYSYNPDPTDKVVEIIENESGRINGGDFSWEFNDSQDDDDYAVNNELMQAIQNYTSQLVSIFGE
jgi:pectate lyase